MYFCRNRRTRALRMPQSASTAELQPFIFNKAAEVSASKETVSGTGLSALKAAPKTMSSKGVHKPILTSIKTSSSCRRWSTLPLSVFPR